MSEIKTVSDEIETSPEGEPKWRDRLLIALVVIGALLTVIWTGVVTYGLGWLASYLLR